MVGGQPSEVVVFNAGVPAFGAGAKERSPEEGVGEGESGDAPTECAVEEGACVRAGALESKSHACCSLCGFFFFWLDEAERYQGGAPNRT
jgi:hypothetical protein